MKAQLKTHNKFNTMKKLFLISFILFFVSCATSPPPDSHLVYESETLKILKYSEHVYQHISYLETESFGKVSCNGMIFKDKNEAIVVDTTPDAQSSDELIQWIQRELNTSIKSVISTHFHSDALGGLSSFHQNGIPSFALDKTVALARENQVKELPQNSFQHSKVFKFGEKTLVSSFLGEGHTPDNTIVYFPDEKVFFGGCLVKALASDKGYLGDSNVEAWPRSIQNLKNHYGRSRLVVPGHGKAGGAELLDYTREIFEE